ncbi:MAG TPA: hypothetical protein VMM78_11010 [Thermomicrobiales bacterium]|nr:hypothetical protein [Thermomicrobiales bacterium]
MSQSQLNATATRSAEVGELATARAVSSHTPTPTPTATPTATPSPTPAPSPTPTATSTPTPTPTPAGPGAHNIPRERQVVLNTSGRGWDYEDPTGVTATFIDGELRVRIDELLDDAYWNETYAQTHFDHYADVSVSVDVRLVEGAGYSQACLIMRADPNWESMHGYHLCLDTIDEQPLPFFAEISCDGRGWDIHDVDLAPRTTAVQSVGEWNTLKIVAHEGQFWFLVNDVLVGTGMHDGPLMGAVGMYVVAEDDVPVEYAFRKLTVRAIADDSDPGVEPKMYRFYTYQQPCDDAV